MAFRTPVKCPRVCPETALGSARWRGRLCEHASCAAIQTPSAQASGGAIHHPRGPAEPLRAVFPRLFLRSGRAGCAHRAAMGIGRLSFSRLPRASGELGCDSGVATQNPTAEFALTGTAPSHVEPAVFALSTPWTVPATAETAPSPAWPVVWMGAAVGLRHVTCARSEFPLQVRITPLHLLRTGAPTRHARRQAPLAHSDARPSCDARGGPRTGDCRVRVSPGFFRWLQMSADADSAHCRLARISDLSTPCPQPNMKNMTNYCRQNEQVDKWTSGQAKERWSNVDTILTSDCRSIVDRLSSTVCRSRPSVCRSRPTVIDCTAWVQMVLVA